MTEPRAGAIRMVVLDVDGTIIANHGPPRLSPGLCRAVAQAHAAGVLVTLATGRTLDYVRTHLAGPLALAAPVVTAQGALIGDPRTGAVLSRRTLEAGPARVACAQIDLTRRLSVLYLISPTGVVTMIEAGSPSRPEHDDLFGVPRERAHTLSGALERQTVDAPLKIIVEAPAGDDAVERLRARVGATLQLSRTHPRLVELTAPGVDKGHGLRELCALTGVPAAQVMAVGDNDNDVPMLREAGLGVALADGSAAARDAADWIAPAYSAGGAEIALRRLL